MNHKQVLCPNDKCGQIFSNSPKKCPSCKTLTKMWCEFCTRTLSVSNFSKHSCSGSEERTAVTTNKRVIVDSDILNLSEFTGFVKERKSEGKATDIILTAGLKSYYLCHSDCSLKLGDNQESNRQYKLRFIREKLFPLFSAVLNEDIAILMADMTTIKDCLHEEFQKQQKIGASMYRNELQDHYVQTASISLKGNRISNATYKSISALEQLETRVEADARKPVVDWNIFRSIPKILTSHHESFREVSTRLYVMIESMTDFNKIKWRSVSNLIHEYWTSTPIFKSSIYYSDLEKVFSYTRAGSVVKLFYLFTKFDQYRECFRNNDNFNLIVYIQQTGEEFLEGDDTFTRWKNLFKQLVFLQGLPDDKFGAHIVRRLYFFDTQQAVPEKKKKNKRRLRSTSIGVKSPKKPSIQMINEQVKELMVDDVNNCVESDEYYFDLFSKNLCYFVGHDCFVVGTYKNLRIPIAGRLLRMRTSIIHKLVALQKQEILRSDLSPGTYNVDLIDWQDGTRLAKSGFFKATWRFRYNTTIFGEDVRDNHCEVTSPVNWLMLWAKENKGNVQEVNKLKVEQFDELVAAPIYIGNGVFVQITPKWGTADYSNLGKQSGCNSKHYRCSNCNVNLNSDDCCNWKLVSELPEYNVPEWLAFAKTGTSKVNHFEKDIGLFYVNKKLDVETDLKERSIAEYRFGHECLHVTMGHIKNMHSHITSEPGFDHTLFYQNVRSLLGRVAFDENQLSSADWRAIYLMYDEVILPCVRSEKDNLKVILETWIQLQKSLYLHECERNLKAVLNFAVNTFVHFTYCVNRWNKSIAKLHLHVLTFHMPKLFCNIAIRELYAEFEESTFSSDKTIQKQFTDHIRESILIELITRCYFRDLAIKINPPASITTTERMRKLLDERAYTDAVIPKELILHDKYCEWVSAFMRQAFVREMLSEVVWTSDLLNVFISSSVGYTFETGNERKMKIQSFPVLTRSVLAEIEESKCPKCHKRKWVKCCLAAPKLCTKCCRLNACQGCSYHFRQIEMSSVEPSIPSRTNKRKSTSSSESQIARKKKKDTHSINAIKIYPQVTVPLQDSPNSSEMVVDE